MKKVLTTLIVVVLVLTCSLTIMSACRAPTDYDHTIVFYSTQGEALRNITNDVIAKFEAKYPGWKVEHDYSAGDYDSLQSKVINDLREGIQPDLAYCYPDHVASYLSTKKVVDLRKYWESTETVTYKGTDGSDKTMPLGFTADERADFYEIFLEDGFAGNFEQSDYRPAGYDENSIFALPFIKSTEAMFYNTNALRGIAEILYAKDRTDDAELFAYFDADGKVSSVRPAETWDDLWAQCALIKEIYGNSVTPFTYDSESNWFITMCMQNDWGYTSIDASAPSHFLWRNQEGLNEWLRDLADYNSKGYFKTRLTLDPTGSTYTSSVFTLGIGTITDPVTYETKTIDSGEGNGSVYCIGSSGGASYQSTTNFTVGVTTIPGSNGNFSAISQGPSFVMLTGGHDVENPSEKERMTWLFMKELLDPTNQIRYCMQNGYNPSRMSAYDLPAFEDYLTERETVSMACNVASDIQDRFFTSPAFAGSSNARAEVGAALIKVLQGTAPEAALQQAYSNCGGK